MPTDTAATRNQVGEGVVNSLVKDLAIKRPGQPGDMVGACLFLLSDEAPYIAATDITIDGGRMALYHQ